MRYFIFFCFVFQMLLAHSGMAQSQNDWTKDEKKSYKTLYAFSHYLHDVPWADWSMKKIFKKYVEFDYVLQDSNEYVVDRHKGLFFFAAIDFIEYFNKMGI